MIYFDNAATSPLSPSVIEAMTQTMGTVFGNPSSLHAHGREAKKLLRDARQTIASCLHTKSDQITFTSGGTESNNTVIKDTVSNIRTKGSILLQLPLSTTLFLSQLTI